MKRSIRRVVTMSQGVHSTVLVDDAATLEKFPGVDAYGAVIWTTGSVPADNLLDRDGASRDAGMSLKGGSVMRVTEFGPGFVTPMHRTLSLDYAIVLAGHLEMELDSGAVVPLRQGDIVVQRGGAHRWRNRSNLPCRIAVAMIEAAPVSSGARTLPPTPEWRMVVSSLLELVRARLQRANGSFPSSRPDDDTGAPLRVVATGHDEHGAAIVLSEHTLPPPKVDGPVARRIVWDTATLPVRNVGTAFPSGSVVSSDFRGGTRLEIVEIDPAGWTDNSTTASIDYVVVLSGEIELVLGNVVSARLGAGDCLVQRGGAHAWRNPSSLQPCRLAVFMVEAFAHSEGS